jgi:hypothetical protein
MNTRKYPRSTLEAFGCRGDAACAIERPSPAGRIAGGILALAIGLCMVVALAYWMADEPQVHEMTEAEKKAELRKQRWERAIESSFKKGSEK